MDKADKSRGKEQRPMDEKRLLMALLRFEVCGAPVDPEVKAALSPELLEKLYALAGKHDLAHIAGQALSKLNLLGEDEISQKLKQAAMGALYRYVRINYELAQICRVLEEAGIPFIPLKGSVLRELYPEPWMRTSCDIDILVRESVLEHATKLLAEKLNYRIGEKWGHDISLFSPSGVHLELHYAVIEDTQVVGSQVVLDHFWDSAVACEGCQFRYRVPDEMFYFYHIAHMAKHVHSGGCGIRPFLDLWILNHRMEYDKKKRAMLLSKGGLLAFDEAAQKVAEHWFSGESYEDSVAQLFENYILDGGVYGSLENSIHVRRINTSRLKYILSRIFIDSNFLKKMFPVMKKHPWLMPFCQVARWVKLLCDGKFRQAAVELQLNATVSQEQELSTKTLLSYLGLEQKCNRRDDSR